MQNVDFAEVEFEVYASQVGRRSAAAQPGNRFVSFVRACAR